MKHRMKRAALAALALAAALVLAGCGSGAYPTSETYAHNTYDAEPYAEEYYPDAPAAAPAPAETSEAPAGGDYNNYGGASLTMPQDDRQVVMSAWMTLETVDFAATCDALEKAATEAGGYASYTSQSGNAADANRYASYTFRVPAENYAQFIAKSEQAGSLMSRDEYTEDVTAQYVDVEARLTSLRTQEKRLLELMENAARLSDLLEVQQQLTEVQYEIERYEAQRRGLDDRTTYSTVDVTVYEVTEPTLAGDAPYSSEIDRAFGESWKAVGNALQEIGIGLVWLVPVLVLLVIIAIPVVAIVLVVRRVRKKRRAKNPPKPKKDLPPPVYYTAGTAAPYGGAPYGSPPQGPPPYGPYSPYPPYPLPQMPPHTPPPPADAPGAPAPPEESQQPQP